ncbi:MAG: toll/interleukin-1 receptor domain-containing protein, partial [Anaerolineae bacterium]|nr:toll/interleukin-1 receptor domain-containing protein [Anaerolineae bacterium]
TTNPQLFLSKKRTTLLLGEYDETKEPTRTRRKSPFAKSEDQAAPLTTSEVGTGLAPGSLTDHILLIYNREEWETTVAPIVDWLYNVETPVWVEQYLSPDGEDWQAALEQARVECWLLIVVVSKGIMEVEYLQRIWRYFHNREKPVILVMCEEIDRLPIGANRAYKIPYDLAQSHGREAGLRQLVHTIKQLS